MIKKNFEELCKQNSTDYLKVETNQDYNFKNTFKTAPESVELITNHLRFARGVKIDAPKFLLLKSVSDKKVNFEGDNRLQAGVYMEFEGQWWNGLPYN